MKLGIVSDIHEDILRLEEALQILDNEGCNEIACSGDIIGYSYPNFGHFESRNASACIRQVRENCKYVVAGNHDLFPVKKIPEFPAGFEYPEDWFLLDYFQRKKLAKDYIWLNEENEFDPLISYEDKKYIRSLPEFLIIETNGLKILLSHYLFPDLSGSTKKYYEEFGPIEDHLDFIKNNKCDLGISGHKHIEGFYHAILEGQKCLNFGTYYLKNELQWIIGPCVVNGKKENGCMVFNTDTFELKVIPLKTQTRFQGVKIYNKNESIE